MKLARTLVESASAPLHSLGGRLSEAWNLPSESGSGQVDGTRPEDAAIK